MALCQNAGCWRVSLITFTVWLSCSQSSLMANVRDDRQMVWVDHGTDIEEAVISHDMITLINKHFRMHNLDCCTNLPLKGLEFSSHINI